MAVMVETTLWVDHFRASTPRAVKDQVLPIVNQRNICVVEPVLFELMANVPRRDRRRLENTSRSSQSSRPRRRCGATRRPSDRNVSMPASRCRRWIC
jgi:hypothetical protein